MYGGFYDSNVIQPHMECQRQRQNAAGILGGYTPSRRTTPPFVGAFYNPRTCEQAVTQPPARQENNGSRSAPLPFPSANCYWCHFLAAVGGSTYPCLTISHCLSSKDHYSTGFPFSTRAVSTTQNSAIPSTWMRNEKKGREEETARLEESVTQAVALANCHNPKKRIPHRCRCGIHSSVCLIANHWMVARLQDLHGFASGCRREQKYGRRPPPTPPSLISPS